MILNAKRYAALAILGLSCSFPSFSQTGARTVISLDKGWLLHSLPDFELWPAQARLTPDQIRQLNCPAPGKEWQPVRVPDDYVVRGEMSPDANPSLLAKGAVCPLGGRECAIPDGTPPQGKKGALNRPGRTSYGGHGYLPLYPAWYTNKITVPASHKGKNVWLDFGGVYRDAIVYVNGQFVDQHASGYTAFRLDITSHVRFGEENTITVFVDPRWFEGWWYEGGGIYRHVRLVIADPLQVAPWGTFVDAQVHGTLPAAGDRGGVQLTVKTTVRNDYPAGRSFTLVSAVLDATGKVVATTSTNQELASGQESTYSQNMDLRDALFWTLDRPYLYTLSTTIRSGDKPVDHQATSFGVRTLRFDPDHGFFLNGRHVEIQGVCSHHDFPGVGIAAADNLWAWRIAKVKAMGGNAWRCAHNPASEAFYDAADRMGILVMDENRHLGDTYFPKADADTPYSDLSDVAALVRQHRNHPSIIMWSLCNEEGQGPKPIGAKMFAAMKEVTKKLDPTRPTTGAVNGGYTREGYISVEDILGMNYHNGEFDKVHAEFPHLMIYGSEDINAKTSRGTRETSQETALCSAYADGDGGQPWKSWIPTVERAFVAGQFVWTGFDYRGEPNPYSWPAATSQVGAMDICGFPKPVYHYWKSAWMPKPSVYIFPDWNFPKSSIGHDVRVRFFSNCSQVELVLNGKSLGKQDMPRNLYLDVEVPYAPGKLAAIGYNNGREAARYEVETAGAPAAVRLVAEVPHIASNGEDIAPVRVEVVDRAGRVVPDAEDVIEFSISGAGTLAGVANGNPASHESSVASQRKAFHGLAMVLVRAGEHAGAITVNAQARGLTPGHVVVTTTAERQARQ